MDRRNSNIVLALAGFFLSFTVVANAHAVVPQDSSVTNCLGPSKFYEELSCQPIFENGPDSCPSRYDCDHWQNLSNNECTMNRKTYKRGEGLRDEDKNPCDHCSCLGAGRWSCMSNSCRGPDPIQRVEGENAPVCYQKNKPTQCCPGANVCLPSGSKLPTCDVDGKTYQAGELFVPSADPKKRCYCDKGYTGENVAPFCASFNRGFCSNALYHGKRIRDGCIPVYENHQNPRKDCSRQLRCPNKKDAVIKITNSTQPNPNMMCKFGTLRMEIGDMLKEDTHWTSACMKCVCEVPPVPTCQVRPSAECNPNEHGN